MSKWYPSGCEKNYTAPNYLNECQHEEGTGFYTSKTPDDTTKPHKELVRKLFLDIEVKC